MKESLKRNPHEVLKNAGIIIWEKLPCSGFTLIELLVFIVVIGLALVGVFSAFNAIFLKSNEPGNMIKASFLARARMSLIEQQRLAHGFNQFTDPCTLNILPSGCLELSSFAANEGFTVESRIVEASEGVKITTVTVSGAGRAVVNMRFVR